MGEAQGQQGASREPHFALREWGTWGSIPQLPPLGLHAPPGLLPPQSLHLRQQHPIHPQLLPEGGGHWLVPMCLLALSLLGYPRTPRFRLSVSLLDVPPAGSEPPSRQRMVYFWSLGPAALLSTSRETSTRGRCSPFREPRHCRRFYMPWSQLSRAGTPPPSALWNPDSLSQPRGQALAFVPPHIT